MNIQKLLESYRLYKQQGLTNLARAIAKVIVYGGIENED